MWWSCCVSFAGDSEASVLPVCVWETEWEGEVQAMRRRVRKNVTKPFPLQEHDYFWGWELEMAELWRHWAMKFSFAAKVFFFFFPPRLHHAECTVSCSQSKTNQRVFRLRITTAPTPVVAYSSANSLQTSSPHYSFNTSCNISACPQQENSRKGSSVHVGYYNPFYVYCKLATPSGRSNYERSRSSKSGGVV